VFGESFFTEAEEIHHLKQLTILDMKKAFKIVSDHLLYEGV
jgi:hypothetical protein